MHDVIIEKLSTTDFKHIEIISQWYFKEWNIPVAQTTQKLANHPDQGIPFQLLLKVNTLPVATGGVYETVSIHSFAPEFKPLSPWIALLYTIPEERGKGFGALLCTRLEEDARNLGLQKIYLFTHTAEKLYARLEWNPIERFTHKDRTIVVMEKNL